MMWRKKKNEKKSSKKKNDSEEEEETTSGGVYGKPKISKEEINKKFANKKAISSEDYADLDSQPYESNNAKNKLSGMKYAQAISSSDLYGGKEDDDEGNMTSKLKDMAFNFTLKAAEKAKELKDKTSGFINRIQNKYGNN